MQYVIGSQLNLVVVLGVYCACDNEPTGCVKLGSCTTVSTSVLSILTLSRLMTYIYMSYHTANLQMLHFFYLFNKYMY